MEYLFYALAIIMALLLGATALFAYLASRVRDIKNKKRLAAIDASSPYRKKKSIKPNNDFKSKDKGLERLKEEQEKNGVTKYNPDGQDLSPAKDQEEVIVGIAKPVGIWSTFIMKQKLGFLLALGGLQGNKKGSWVNRILAQDTARGKGQGQGR